MEDLIEVDAIQNPELYAKWYAAYDCAQKKTKPLDEMYGFSHSEDTFPDVVAEFAHMDYDVKTMKFMLELMINNVYNHLKKNPDKVIGMAGLIADLERSSSICSMLMLHDSGNMYTVTDCIRIKSEAASLMGNTFKLGPPDV